MNADPVVVVTSWHTDHADGQVELRYDPKSPFEVRVTFHDGGEVTDWTFARCLLLDGVDWPTGLGAVVVAPAGRDSVLLRLCSIHGEATVFLPSPAVRRFVALSLAAVPLGAETLDLDDWTVAGAIAGWTS